MHQRKQAGRAKLHWLVMVLAATSCGPETEPIAERGHQLAHSGRWKIPADVLQAGNKNYVKYTGAGNWPGSCAGRLRPGAKTLAQYLTNRFPKITHIDGYVCRRIHGTSRMSSHGKGRALDLFIKLVGGKADNDAGDPVGNWLIVNAKAVGIQYVVWDRTRWQGSKSAGAKAAYYGGSHPHHDHLHIELSVDGAEQRTKFFADRSVVTNPGSSGCVALPPQGGVIDEEGPCMELHGKDSYWRSVDGEGQGGSLLWTNAFQSASPLNWARWQVKVEQAGDYLVEYHAVSAYAVHATTRYAISHDGKQAEKIVDQSAAAAGWNPIGSFFFAAAGAQHVSVFDNEQQAVPSDQHIVVDGIRLTPLTPPPEETREPTGNHEPEETLGDDLWLMEAPMKLQGNAYGGCQLINSQHSPLTTIALLLVLLGIRRHRAKRRIFRR